MTERGQGFDWQAFDALAAAEAGTATAARFAADPARFGALCLRLDDLLIDFSKTCIGAGTLARLTALAEAAALPGWIERLFAGAAVNVTEQRPALHMAVRAPEGARFTVDGRDVMPEVLAVRRRIAAFATEVRSGAWRCASGASVAVVGSVGGGGAGLGLGGAGDALTGWRRPSLDVRFVANIDPADLAAALDGLDPARTLVTVASKSFGTQETLANAEAVRAWLGPAASARQIVAITANTAAAERFGIGAEQILPLWDWVGGRYSLWSAVGLPVALAFGPDAYLGLLEGAAAMDAHFRTAPLGANLPVALGLVAVWNAHACGAAAHAILPYDHGLRRLPAYLQQAAMESNGKSVTRDGAPVARAACPVLFGEPGTLGQHAFYQLMHQGRQTISADFIVPVQDGSGACPPARQALIANALAQSEALMRGIGAAEIQAELTVKGMDPAAAAALVPHRVAPGNRPSTAILFRRVDPVSLGRLIALYEHRIFVESVLYGINAFDQWGVELGKVLARSLLPAIAEGASLGDRDASTAGLVAEVRKVAAGG